MLVAFTWRQDNDPSRRGGGGATRPQAHGYAWTRFETLLNTLDYFERAQPMSSVLLACAGREPRLDRTYFWEDASFVGRRGGWISNILKSLRREMSKVLGARASGKRA